MEHIYSLVSLEELKELIVALIPFVGRNKTVSGSLFINLSKVYFGIAFENKIEVDHMRAVIQRDMREFKKDKKARTESHFIKHYTAMYTLKIDGFVDVEIGGKMVKINKKELDNIQKI